MWTASVGPGTGTLLPENGFMRTKVRKKDGSNTDSRITLHPQYFAGATKPLVAGLQVSDSDADAVRYMAQDRH